MIPAVIPNGGPANIRSPDALVADVEIPRRTQSDGIPGGSGGNEEVSLSSSDRMVSSVGKP
jgi:hypothetical protein